MRLIRILFFLFAITAFASVSTVLNIYNYNPFQSGFNVFVSFYSSLTIALVGIITIIVYYLKIKLYKTETTHHALLPSIRQATLFSLGLVTLLILQGLHILDWLSGISILIIGILIELFFQTKKVHTSK